MCLKLSEDWMGVWWEGLWSEWEVWMEWKRGLVRITKKDSLFSFLKKNLNKKKNKSDK